MLEKFPVVHRLSFLQPNPEINSRRLGYIHELMHYCNTDCRSWEEITRAFKLLTLESLALSGCDECGELEGAGRALDGDGRIPWDNPAAFAREIIQISSVRKMYQMMAADLSGGDREHDAGEEESEGAQDVRGPETPRADLRDIQKTQRRSLSDWCYSEHYEPAVLLQVLQEALESYSCMDSYYHTQDHSLLIVLHNPMDAYRQSQESWDMALHSNVSFRNYLELVADSISHWVQEEESKYQEEQTAKELEAVRQAQARKDSNAAPRDPSPNKKKTRKSVSPKKSKSPKGSGSRPGSRGEDATPEPAQNPFILEGSLKAWKEEQDRLKEEELLKQEKKNAKNSKSGNKKRGGSKDRPDSERRRSPSAQKKSAKEKEKDDGAKVLESEPAPSDVPEEPSKKAHKFIGYDMGDNLIQVSGGCRRLFPTDGGQIQVEHTRFEKGSTYVKVKIQKDGHRFLVHIVNPRKTPPEEDLTQMDQQGNPVSKRRGVSEFGSFSATLHSGVRLSLSHNGSSGLTPEEKDPELEAMLTIPSIHTPSIMPAPPPQPPPPSSPGKGRKSPRGKSPRAARVKTPQAPAVEEPLKTPEVKVEPVTPPVTPVTKPVQIPAFQALNVSYPTGLLLTFMRDNTRECCDNSQNSPRLLIRQTYPVKVRDARLYRQDKMADIEASRVITAEGSVIRSMLDGSTQILLPDGTLIQSPDSGPVREPRPQESPSMETSETPGTEAQPGSPPEEPKEPRQESAPETKRSRGGHRSAPTPAKPETADLPPPPADSAPTTPSAPAPTPGTWITTAPSGERIGTRGSQRLELKPLLTCRATDPVTGAVMTTREDQVVTVRQTDGTTIAEHADGTRISTFYQDVDVPLPGDHEETGEVPQSVMKKVKFIRVEKTGFVSVILNCEENTCHAESGDGTEILARPQGSYQVFPPNSGCLSINHEGRAVYSPQTSPMARVPTRQQDLPPSSYVMSHTQNVISEVLDPEGNLFQVMLDGSTSVVIAGGENCEEEEEEKDKVLTSMVQHAPEVYDLHAPRFFMVNADGSGSELLRNREVEDFLTTCYGDPAIAVIREPTQEAPGVQSITVLQPFPDISPWTMKKHLDNIVPPNLLSRDWATFPSIERKVPGPPLGIGVWKGLNIGSEGPKKPRPPVLRCPKVLRIRQLRLYEPIGEERRERLELSLQEYINRVITKEEETRERDIKDPRTAEEKEGAAELLQLVLSLTDAPDAPPQTRTPTLIQEANMAARLYESATAPPPAPPPPVAKPQRSLQDWEKIRQEIQDQKDQQADIRGHKVPPYFQSELGREFLQKQAPDLDLLSRKLPPLSRHQREIAEEEEEEEEELTVSIEDQESDPRTDSDSSTPKVSATPYQETGEDDFLYADIIPARRYQPLSHSLDVDVTGRPRRERVKLPTSILSGKPASLPNAKFAAVEDAVRRSVRTASTSATSHGGEKPLPRGFHLIPSVVQFGVLREGNTYCTSVTIKNVGVDFCRFRVKQPPPSTGLRVTYTPGPVAAGMKTRLDLELFAMAVGLDGPEGAAQCAHCIQIQSEVETLYLPVTATVLTEGFYESGSDGRPHRVLGPGVRLISTTPHSRLELLRPRRVTDSARSSDA